MGITMKKYGLQIPVSVKNHEETLKKSYGLENMESFRGAIIFGTGILGVKTARLLKDLKIDAAAFSDNDSSKWGKNIKGLPVIPPRMIVEREYSRIIIASKYVRDIYFQLKKMQLERIVPHYVISVIFPDILPNPLHSGAMASIIEGMSGIEKVYARMEDEESKNLFIRLLRFRVTLSPEDLPAREAGQYYPGKFWKLSKNERYVDVGAFDGDTLKDFITFTKGSFRKYIALEPDKDNFLKLCANIPVKHVMKVIPLLAGAGSAMKDAYFSAFGRDDSSVSETGTDKIRIVALDSLEGSRDFTTLKIDVEGYEPEVLKGAKKCIKTGMPKLAVCVYHRPDHLWRLPLQILKYNGNYKFYLRHHEPEIFGTVLYGVKD
ncbi:MAG: FkbM family methyltransferase [Candidatus Omnitrophota bacterium]